MKNTNTFGVHFFLRKNKAVNGHFPIYGKISVNKNKVEMAIKKSLALNDWNEGKGAAKPTKNELKALNTQLEEIRATLASHYMELVMAKVEFKAETVKNKFLQLAEFAATPKEETKTLKWLVKEHNTKMQSILRWGSLKNYDTTERYIHNYLNLKFPNGDIPLKGMNYEFLSNFEFYVRTTPLKKNDPCTNNGTMKHLERIKKMVAWAVKNEWIEKDPFINYKLKFKYPLITYLEADELDAIENKQINDPMLAKVRDLFVFSCYTAISYSDLMQLTDEQIMNGIGGFQWIKSSRQKTDVAYYVPLLPKPLAILAKYKPVKGDILNRTSCFPYISIQTCRQKPYLIRAINSSTKCTCYRKKYGGLYTEANMAKN